MTRIGTLRTTLRPTTRVAQTSQQILTSFAAGHGWVANGAGTINLNDTGDGMLSGQCVTLTSTGTGSGYAEVMKSGLTAFDATKKAVRVWFRFPGSIATLAKLQVFAGESPGVGYFVDAYAPQTGIPLPDTDARYNSGAWTQDTEWHSVTVDFSSSGAPSGSPTTKAAMTEVRVRLSDQGGGTVVARIGGVALVDRPITRFPNGVVSFTFDDGYLSQYTAARVALDKYGYGATAHVIQDLISVDGSSVTYMSLKNCHDLEDHHGWEIAAHSATNADHSQAGGLAALSESALRANFETHKAWLLSEGFRGADLLAYPQGLFNDTTLRVARDYFSTARTTAFGYPETAPPPYPLRMRSLPVQYNAALASLTALVDRVKAHRGWGQFYLHEVRAGVSSGQSTDPTTFAGLVDYIAAQGVPVLTVGEVLAAGRAV